jgi:hypothetical protein
MTTESVVANMAVWERICGEISGLADEIAERQKTMGFWLSPF